MDPNIVLSAWQMTVMAIVPVLALAIWLIAVYAVARDTGEHEQAAAGSPAGSATALSGSRPPSVVSEREPGRPPTEKAAA